MILLECVALYAKELIAPLYRAAYIFCRLSLLLLIAVFIVPAYAQYTSWARGGGTNASLKFSGLSQINLANVHNLELAWKYQSDHFRNIQTSPIFVKNTVITAARDGSVICLDAATGGHLYGYTKSDTTVAYKLKDCSKNKFYAMHRELS